MDVGIVGGSDLAKQEEQLGKDSIDQANIIIYSYKEGKIFIFPEWFSSYS